MKKEREMPVEVGNDIRKGLTSEQKYLPPKYFYDDRGSRLFGKICELAEYYLTRVESAILSEHSSRLAATYKPEVAFEIGSGAAEKTRIVLDAMADKGRLKGIGLLDVNREFLAESVKDLLNAYPEADVKGVSGDFTQPFMVPFAAGLRRLIMFLGSTIGNLNHMEAVRFLGNVAGNMSSGDVFLLGTDLDKNPELLQAAYNDSEGVTAEFNLNILRVINNELDGDFDTALFEHRAIYNSRASRIEMYLDCIESHSVALKRINLNLEFEKGESILTEISRKYTKTVVRNLLGEVGIEMLEWLTDDNGLFAISIGTKSGS